MGNDFHKKTTKEIGTFGEEQAARYLKRHGYWIKARNFRSGNYEIDLIAASPFTIAFVEVKTRNYHSQNLTNVIPPADAVDESKIKFTRAAANHYLAQHPTWKRKRMDIVEIWMVENQIVRIRHIKNAY